MPATEMLTPPKLAKRYGVSVDKIIRWILAGELAAMNLATVADGRPRYKITEEAVQAFEARRATRAPVLTRRRKRTAPADIVRHFR